MSSNTSLQHGFAGDDILLDIKNLFTTPSLQNDIDENILFDIKKLFTTSDSQDGVGDEVFLHVSNLFYPYPQDDDTLKMPLGSFSSKHIGDMPDWNNVAGAIQRLDKIVRVLFVKLNKS